MTTSPAPTTVTVNGVDYVRADTTGYHDGQTTIVVLQRGWVAVGRLHQDDDKITLTDASIIRRWGTTKGLGELVNGPTSETVLDPAGTIRGHILTVVLSIPAPNWQL